MQGRRAAWYPDPKDETALRFWSGETWTGRKAMRLAPVQVEQPPKGSTPDGLIVVGVALLLVAGVALGVAAGWNEGREAALAVAALVTVPAYIILTVGLIAKAVQVGMRAHRREYG